jgi:hypothetical protein
MSIREFFAFSGMTVKAARMWIVKWSLLLISFYGIFFIMAPIAPYPLGYKESVQLIELIFPLFLGYLSTAVVFTFEGKDVETYTTDLLGALTKGPFFVATALSLALFTSYWFSQSTLSPLALSRPMEFETFSSLFSAILGIYTATTSALVAYLFGFEKQQVNQPAARGENPQSSYPASQPQSS